MNIHITIEQSAEDNQWYWHAQSANNEIVANGEGYHNRQDAVDIVNGLFLEENSVVVDFA